MNVQSRQAPISHEGQVIGHRTAVTIEFDSEREAKTFFASPWIKSVWEESPIAFVREENSPSTQ